MGLLSKVQSAQQEVQMEEVKDSIGGFSYWPSDVYDLTINMAFLRESSGGSIGLNLFLKNDKGQQFRTILYLTSNLANGQKTFSVVEGKNIPKAAYVLGDNIAKIITNTSLFDLEEEERTVMLYDFDARAEKATKVPALPELIGGKFKGGILHRKANKQVQDNSGKWVPTADITESNVLSKVFNEEGFTVLEAEAEAEKTDLMDAWLDKYKGQVDDRVKSVSGSTSSSAAAPTTSMFN